MKGEASIMWAMGWPMVVSFICRIGMASTDSSFVGHLTNRFCPHLRRSCPHRAAAEKDKALCSTIGTFLDHPYSAEEYLAAASLSAARS